MSQRKCPLCSQPVTDELFEKITGIWKAREAQEKELEKEKKTFLAQQKVEKKKLWDERRKMKADQKKQVEARVKLATEKFEEKIKGFEEEKKKIQDRADKKILAAVKQAESKAKTQYQTQLKVQLEKSVSKEVKKSTAKLAADKKKTDLTLASTLKQMSTLQTQSSHQQTKIKNLERQLKNKTTPQLEGLLYEETLTTALQKEFPSDKLKNTGKGGDILHEVFHQKEASGVIVYECKKVGHWNGAHLDQAAEAKMSRHADFGILVTNANKKNTSGFFIEKGVIVVNPGGVLAIANVLRDQLIKMAQLKMSKAEREEAVENTLKYLQGPEFKNSLDVIVRKAIELNEDLKKEYEDHMKTWKKRQDSLKTVYLNAVKVKTTTLALMSGEKPLEKSEVETAHFHLLSELSEKGK